MYLFAGFRPDQAENGHTHLEPCFVNDHGNNLGPVFFGFDNRGLMY